MKQGWRQRLAERRIRPGDGRPLPRFRWWQLFSRSLFLLNTPAADYAVDVRHGGDGRDGEVRARLYRDGLQQALSKMPAHFPVEGGVIEVEAGGFGMKRCHFVTTDGAERLLTPHPASAQGRRARLEQTRPGLSRSIAVVSTALVLIGVTCALLQLIDPISQIPPIREAFGSFESPLRLPLWANISLGVVTVLGSTERALRLRSSWLDSIAN
ncbi:hypothetical protein [Cryobacterium sp. SO1]|uniref:hypothetical protein n=1 Tax=Cryobacterium sp. SO1 TaxID=1897061 RepID=UPI001022A8C0|nr:hypothetical protein [Cryobacterium sp. SO1]RZI37558.1 hypothetical protein BJQ95_00033 [Cryobacterium sp. SO1]